jgi:hypothetical protein
MTVQEFGRNDQGQEADLLFCHLVIYFLYFVPGISIISIKPNFEQRKQHSTIQLGTQRTKLNL